MSLFCGYRAKPNAVNATLRKRTLPYCSDDNFGNLRAPAEFTQREAPKVI